jgi:hypothetical protein
MRPERRACRFSSSYEYPRVAATPAEPLDPHRAHVAEKNDCAGRYASRSGLAPPFPQGGRASSPGFYLARTVSLYRDLQIPSLLCLLAKHIVIDADVSFPPESGRVASIAGRPASFTAPGIPYIYDWHMPIRKPSQSRSHHFRPSISLIRSPTHMAKMHIVRNGSGMCSSIRRNSSTERALGSRFLFERP